MFCSYCGNEFDDGETVCPKCGAYKYDDPETAEIYTEFLNMQAEYKDEEKDSRTYSILGIIFAFIIPILGLIFSIIGLKSHNNKLATVGIVLSVLIMIISFVVGLIFRGVLLGLII